MLSLTKLFDDIAGSSNKDASSKEDISPLLATCVILLEVAYADDEFSPVEKEHMIDTLCEYYDLSRDDAKMVINEAMKARDKSLDIFQFTNRINSSMTDDEKWELMIEVWRIILVDDTLDAHEDYIAHKLARLLNMKHEDLIDAKLTAKDSFRDSDTA
ncbi:MAG: TerB family tellurite resistance protein [Candidatus Electryonea clarkiae]|nr:TerB family tellurite resistance protein [Candidatus Electryonea clarkiae]MDP8289043.1 TerB family tellurite resistance protein [Candidatus Electryonea clarkiae]